MSDFNKRAKAANTEFLTARADRRVHRRYRDAGTGEFVTKWVAVPTDEQVDAAAEAIFKLQYPGFEYMNDAWALDFARVALDAAAEVQA